MSCYSRMLKYKNNIDILKSEQVEYMRATIDIIKSEQIDIRFFVF